jgi:amino-acid N-acetyltransferase
MRTEFISFGADVESLLTQAGLPVSDLQRNQSLTLLGIRESGRVVAVIGVEAYGPVGLLRSLAVAETHRKTGLGRHSVSSAEAWAAERWVAALYLLTTTAVPFFASLGYESVSRSEAPEAITKTAQFTELCPASAAFMRKVLVVNR